MLESSNSKLEKEREGVYEKMSGWIKVSAWD